MRKVWRFALPMLALVALIGSGILVADDKEVPIKEVMQKCMKGGLCKKVADGKASDEEKKQLLSMFTALSKNKPPKGEGDSWKEKTGALVAAAKECAEGKDSGPGSLKKAANCKGCHDVHKGK